MPLATSPVDDQTVHLCFLYARTNPHSLRLLDVCRTKASVVPMDFLQLEGHLDLTAAVVASVVALQPKELRLYYMGPGRNPDRWRADVATYATLELLQKCLPGLKALELNGYRDYLPTSALQCLHLGTGLCTLHLDYTEEDDHLLSNQGTLVGSVVCTSYIGAWWERLVPRTFCSRCQPVLAGKHLAARFRSRTSPHPLLYVLHNHTACTYEVKIPIPQRPQEVTPESRGWG
jgi:hypothetical protein